MYKVFVKDVPIIFSNGPLCMPINWDAGIHPDILIENGSVEISGNAIDLIHEVFADYKLVIAAGGVVVNQLNEILIIKRNGLWDLPKGKLEKGERISECAIREVEEECSVYDLTILRELPSTFHTYFHKGKDVLKRTYWYEMSCPNQNDLIPQEEEGIEAVEWIPKKELLPHMEKGYQSLLHFAKVYLDN